MILLCIALVFWSVVGWMFFCFHYIASLEKRGSPNVFQVILLGPVTLSVVIVVKLFLFIQRKCS